jgi:acylphosphatase
MPYTAAHLIVSGRVQGVGFRYFVREKANSLGIKGWVRNKGNGDVEILAEGEKETLAIFIEAVRNGPTFANVEELIEDRLDPYLEFSTFSITN